MFRFCTAAPLAALAEVVEARGDDARPPLLVAVDEDLELVGVVERVGAQEGAALEEPSSFHASSPKGITRTKRLPL